MGGGNTKPASAELEDDEIEEEEEPQTRPQGRNRDVDNDYARNQQEREEMSRQTRKPTTQQQKAPQPPPQRTPVRSQAQPQYREEDEDEEEEDEPQQAPNNRADPRQQGRSPVNNRQPGNSPTGNKQTGNQSMVSPKAGGNSGQMKNNGVPNIPKGKPGASNQGKSGNAPGQQGSKPGNKPGNMPGKAPAAAGMKAGGAGQGNEKTLVVERQRIVRKQDPNTVFTQFVNFLKTDIPYPVSMQALKENRTFDTYIFTSNTNIFHGLDEEKLIVVPLSELTKVYDALDAAEQGDCLDETFPPTIESLADIPGKQAPFKSIIWKKISEQYPKREIPIIFKTDKPESIDPGDLRDLAFQSVVAIVLENDGVIPSNFHDVNELSHKVYSIWLNDGGEWECFIIDENFPFDKGVNDWAFTKAKDTTDPNNFESWVLIMEKAFAKMYGCYERLERGHPAHFLHDITGAPYDHFYFDDEQKCWEFLDAINGQLTVVVAMSKNPNVMIENESMVDKAPAYCYKVHGQVEIRTPQGKQRLIQMKSPWGFANWQGDWAKNSPNWTPDLMNELNPNGYKDDTYWVSLSDFVKSFGVGFIYTLFHDYIQCSLRLDQTMQKNYSLVLINVPSTGGHGFLKISQKDARHFETIEGGHGYEYSVVKMMLVKVDSKMKLQTFKGGIFDKGRDCELEVVLEGGDYLVYIEIDWLQEECMEIVFNSYHEWNLVMYELDSKEDQATVLRRFLKCYFLTASQQRTVEKYTSGEDGQIEKLSEYVYGYLCFYYLNLSRYYAVEETVRMNSLYGLEICPPYQNNFEFDVLVPHGKDNLVIYTTSSQSDSAYHYQHTVWSVVYPDCDDENLKNLVIEKATGYKRRSSTKGGDIDLIIFTYEFEGGFVWYYLNKTPYIYEELLVFDVLTNMIDFDENYKQEYNLFIRPNEGAFVKYRVDDPTMPYNYSTRLKFRLVDPMSMKMNQNMPMLPGNEQGGEEDGQGQWQGQGQGQPKKGPARSGPKGTKKPTKANMPGSQARQGGGQTGGQGGGQGGY